MKTVLATAAVAAFVGSASASVILTGVIDGSFDGTASSPKGIEIYVAAAGDYTGWSIQVESNGGSNWSGAFNFDQFNAGVYAEGFYYITSTDADMIATFASATVANTISDSSFNQNGNDAFRVLDGDDAVIDQYGDPSEVSGSGDYADAWAYRDSFTYRNNGTGPDGGFNLANWTPAGDDFLDANDDNDALAPFGTYQVPAPGAAGLLAVAGVSAARRRRA